MPPPKEIGDRHVANWNLFSKNSRKIIVLIGDLALTNMGLGDKAAQLALAEAGDAAIPIEKDAVTGPYSDRDPRSRGGADGRARPRHRRFTETTLDTVCRLTSLKALRSLLRCFGSIPCSIRSGMIRASKNSARKSSREPAQFSYPDYSCRRRVNSAEVRAVVAGGSPALWQNSSFRSGDGCLYSTAASKLSA